MFRLKREKKGLSSLGNSLQQHALSFLVVGKRRRWRLRSACMMAPLRVNTGIDVSVRSLIYGYPARVGAALSLQAGIVRLVLCIYNIGWYCRGMRHVFPGISMWNVMYFLRISSPRVKRKLIWRTGEVVPLGRVGRETHCEFLRFKPFSLLHLRLESALRQWLKPDKTSDCSSNKKNQTLLFFAHRNHLLA